MEPQNEKRRIEALRMREYRRTHKTYLSNYNRARWAKTRRYARRTARLGDSRCMFCEVRLAGKSVAMKHKKYCNGCLANPVVKRYLKALYRRRWLQKKAGQPVESVVFLDRPYVKGRKPIAPLVPNPELSTYDPVQTEDGVLS